MALKLTQMALPHLDTWSLAGLYQAAVPQHAGKYRDQIIAQSRFGESGKSWFVVHDGEHLVGAAAMVKARDNVPAREWLNRFIEANRQYPENRAILEARAKMQGRLYGGGEIVIEPFDNEVTRQVERVRDDDVYLFGAAVHPDYRRRGIATLLAEARISAAGQMRAGAAFVSCVEQSGTSSLYGRLDFSPIFLFGPEWYGGSAVRQMGKML